MNTISMSKLKLVDGHTIEVTTNSQVYVIALTNELLSMDIESVLLVVISELNSILFPLTISEAASMLDVCPKTLRNWEAQGKVTSIRTEGNHRRYLETDLNKLKEKV